MKSLGQVAYDAYCETRGWKAFNGDPLPTWEAMMADPKRKDLCESWQAAGQAVENYLITSAVHRRE